MTNATIWIRKRKYAIEFFEFYKPDGTVDFIIRVCDYGDNETAYHYFYNYRHYTNVYDKSLARKNTDGESWYIGSSVLDYRYTAMEAAFVNYNRVIFYFVPNGSTKTVDEIKTDFYYLFKMSCAYNG